VPRDNEREAQYRKLWSVPDIMAVNGDPAPGIVTTQDEFAISFTPREAADKVESFLATKDEADARLLFQLCSQSQWSYDEAKKTLPFIPLGKATRPILYRPFDKRWTVWDVNVAVHRRLRSSQRNCSPPGFRRAA